jgi:hypothetical protein
LDEAVVDQHVVREILPALGLNVIDRLNPERLDPDDFLLSQAGQLLSRKEVGAGVLKLLLLVF